MIDRRINRAFLVLAVAGAALLAQPPRAAAQDQKTASLQIGFITQVVPRIPPLPYLDAPPADDGIAGARLAASDDNTTGRFTGQHFSVDEMLVPKDGDVVAGFRKLVAEGIRLVVVDLPEPGLLALADLPEAKDVTLFNVAAPDDDLRADKCRANILHTVPSRSMLTDALVQYFILKRWPNIFLVTGTTAADQAYAAAMKRSINKFQARLVAEKVWAFKPGARQTDTGHFAINAEVAHFTQGVDYDVLVVADEDDEFGDYLSYQTYNPRPVAGTQGLMAAGWARPHQEWGAIQLQSRFRLMAHRWMTATDYASWLAVRAIGEGATRTSSVDPAKIMAYVRSDKFQLGGYKGVPLSFRPWDGQMRQAIVLYDTRALVSVSPQPGFLHQFSELDTLGIDRPETKCHMH